VNVFVTWGRRPFLRGFAIAMASPFFCSTVFAGDDDLLKSLDVNHDGVLSLKEVLSTVGAEFSVLDKDKDNSISKHEASAAGVTNREFVKFDLELDDNLDLKEFTELVKARFKAADLDGNQVIDQHELESVNGQALSSLLK